MGPEPKAQRETRKGPGENKDTCPGVTKMSGKCPGFDKKIRLGAIL